MDESIDRMEQRITNLEVALQAIWVLLKRDLPESYAISDIDQMMQEHFQAAAALGGCRRAHMDIDG